MNKIKFYVDACACDLNENLIKENDISFIYPYISFNNRDYLSDSSWRNTPLNDYLNWVRRGNFFSITQPSVKLWADVFEKDLEEGYDILFLSLSQRFSGGYKQAQIAKNLLLSKYKSSSFEIIDSTLVGASLKLLALKISNLIKENSFKTLEELAPYVRSSLIPKITNYWVCDSLKNVAYMGRGSDSFDEKKVPTGSPLITTTDGTFSVISLSPDFNSAFETLKKNLKPEDIEEWEFAYSLDFDNPFYYSNNFTIHLNRESAHSPTYMGPTNVAIAGLHSFNIGILKKDNL
jgi:fatty acid-binding protein DegV